MVLREGDKAPDFNLKDTSGKQITLNGLLLENLEYIPKSGTTLKIDNYQVEVTQVSESSVKMARIKIVDDNIENEIINDN